MIDKAQASGDYRTLLPGNLYSAEQTRLLDSYAIDTLGIPALLLMERAGRVCFEHLGNYWPQAKQITVLAGCGNNAGDGYVIAALAHIAGMQVMVLQVGQCSQLRGAAALCYQRAKALGVSIIEVLTTDELADYQSLLLESDVLIDALLGLGIQGEVRALYAALISRANKVETPVMAVDIPSGLCPDTGQVLGVALKADITVTFIAVKQGLLTGSGPDYTGRLVFNDLQMPASVYQQVSPVTQRLDLTTLRPRLPTRLSTAHKGNFGHVLVMGGDRGMAGAVLMAATAVAQVGAGLVSIATLREHCGAVIARQPELMCHAISDRSDDFAHAEESVLALIEKATTLVVGPGLGQSAWSIMLLRGALEAKKPTVIDADALNLLSQMPELQTHPLCIITPHPKEASRLLRCTLSSIQQDRFMAARELAQRFHAVAVLKGAGTLISDGEMLSLASVGGPLMASAGMGDILSGVIGGLLAQGLAPYEAAQLGVVLHGTAADRLALQRGQRGVMAMELLPVIQHLLHQLHT